MGGYSFPEVQLCAGGDVLVVPERIPDPAFRDNVLPSTFTFSDAANIDPLEDDPDLAEAIRLSLATETTPAKVLHDEIPNALPCTDDCDNDLAEAIRLSLQTSPRVNGVVLLE